MLICLSVNIRKLFKFYDGKLDLSFWKAPNDIKTEYFKKPSAKRLTNKVNKKSCKSINQKNKDSYHYAK